MTELEELRFRIKNALTAADCVDGAHHKQYTIDQMLRCLTGCEMVDAVNEYTGKTYKTLGESEEYKAWVAEYQGKCDDGSPMYEWDVGIG